MKEYWLSDTIKTLREDPSQFFWKGMSLFLLFYAVTFLVTGLASACPVAPHYVEIQIFDSIKSNGFTWFYNSPGATVTATQDLQVSESAWFNFLIGDTRTVIKDGENQTGITDYRGYVALPLYEMVRYNISVTTFTGKTKFFHIYPRENEYHIYMGDAD